MVRKPQKSAGRRAQPYSSPVLSPLYDQPPFEYRDLWSLLVTFRTDPAAIAHLIPKPLVADPAGTMSVTISRFFTSGFGSYNEMLLAAAARYDQRPVNFCLYLVLDNDIAIGAGREIWGFPKKLGRVVVDERDGVLTGRVERGGLELVRAAMQVARLGSAADLGASAEYVNLKLVPSVEKGAPPEVQQLTSTTLTGIDVKRVYTGPATLGFGASPADRFDRIPVVEVLGGCWYNADFTLGHGQILHDYLV